MLLRKLALTASLVPSLAMGGALDLEGLGDQALACRDFDEYVNGRWRQATPIPAHRARIGSYDTLVDASRAIVERALSEAVRDPSRLDTPGKRLATVFFASGMDLAAIEKRQLASLRPLLRQIDQLNNRAQLPALLAQFARVGISAPIGVQVDTDAKDRRRYILELDQGGLGLPDRDDYFLEDERSLELRRAYQTYRVRLASLVGRKDTAAAAAGSLQLQKAWAAAAQSRVERRDPNAVYQLNTLDSLAQRAPGLDWRAFFKALGAPEPGEFNVTSPAFVARVAETAAKAPLAHWRAYLRERLLDALAPTLPKAFVAARFDYRERAIRGQESEVPRTEYVIGLITGRYGAEPLAEGLGQLFIEHAFSAAAKTRAVQMVEGIKAAMRERIQQLDWMTLPTRQSALKKLDAMALKIGYPDRWRTYEGLSIEPGDFSGNWLRARKWFFDDRLGDLKRPVDRTRWFVSPHLVNAIAGDLNDIIFPAAILQPPYFRADADPAINYGAIGMVIGHEITHHFDDAGRQYDSDGNLADWWAPEDAAAYKARTERIDEQYSGYRPLPGQAINGRQTLGENIADLGGISIAYDGLQRALARAPIGPIDGLTQSQRFFISFATVWRTQFRVAALLDQLRTGWHSPGRYRVLGPLAHLDEFATAFNCPDDAPMLRPRGERITVW